ncbi:hypothetical protein, partial [Cyclobacterium roseum]|uniref:hypothetical protein n=1 Tax=Cyclobacterium roseum TaxID=2666137 RepID=UPI001F4290F4
FFKGMQLLRHIIVNLTLVSIFKSSLFTLIDSILEISSCRFNSSWGNAKMEIIKRVTVMQDLSIFDLFMKVKEQRIELNRFF